MKNKLVKKLTACALAAALVTGLAACGTKDEGNNSGDADASAPRT